MNIHLGFEVGTGKPVEVPCRHMVVTGQTQEAGKTTALEALISRSGLRAVTFVTKRGEASFTDARRIDPYFREQADWQFVASILEASRGEKLKFERAWIIRASKGARTLADVHRNVKKAMETAKGMSADVYLTLDAYLEAVVPQISRVKWATSVQLSSGVNAVDLTTLNVEMQHLVIKSTLDWILEHEEKTIVVVPEAWKFIPQGRGTPVKLSAESFIRQGAGLGNYLWLDSQDIAGVEKIILKSCPLWILGVQRESNEIKRTLDNIPGGISKPKANEVATLALGQFLACWGRHVIKTYVQPAWMKETDAKAVALDSEHLLCIRPRPEQIKPPPQPPPTEQKENTVTESEANKLKEENRRLTERVEQLEKSHAPQSGPSSFATPDAEGLFQLILKRLLREPSIIKLQLSKPEIEVSITRKTIQIDEFSLKGRIARLLSEGFFKEPRGCSSIRTALKRTGPDCNTGNIGRSMDEFTRDGFFTDEGSGYREVPDMKVNIIKA